MRYLVQVQPQRMAEVKTKLTSLGFTPITTVYNFITVDVPSDVVPTIRTIPGVVSVIPEKTYSALYVPVPVSTKMTEFVRLLRSNPITGPPSALAYSIQADNGKARILTSVSRNMLGADVAEKEGITGKGIKVAVLDTGTDYTGSQGSFSGGKSAVDGQPIAWDENGHGTHVATTVGGRPFNSIRGLLKGVASEAEVAAFKCLGYVLGMGTTTAILKAFQYAEEWGADVMNLSLGGEDEDYEASPYHGVIKSLTTKGIIVVIAAGNSGPTAKTIGSPGCMPDSLTIGAVDINGKTADFSSRGPTLNGLVKPDCTAPGVDILSSTATGSMIAIMQTMDGPRLACISGTCLTGDTLVLLEGGHVKRLSEVEVGDTILTPLGKDIVLAFMPQGEAQVYKVEMEDGRSIEATQEHKFMVRSKKGTTWAKPSEYEWKELKDLKPKDELVLYRMTKREVANLLWQDSFLQQKYGDHDNPYIPQFVARGCRNPFYGKKHTEETKRRLSEVSTGKPTWNKGLTVDDQRVKQAIELSQSHGFGTYERTPDILERLSASLKGRKVWNKGISPSQETRSKISETLKQRHKSDPDYHRRVVAQFRAGFEKHLRDKPMTRGEAFTIAFLDTIFPGEYRFNNGWFKLQGHYPDVVNVNGKKKIIEILGERWHQRSEEETLKQLYSSVGYDCLILWSREFEKKPDVIMRKLREFAANDMKDRTKVRRVISITPSGVKPIFDITTRTHCFVANGFVVHNSMATPHVAGLVALALQYARSKGKKLTTQGIKDALALYGHAQNNETGHGLITYSMLRRYVDERL